MTLTLHQPGPLLLLAEYVEAMCDEGADAYLSLSRAFELEAKLRAFSPAALRAQAAAEAELRVKLEAVEAELEKYKEAIRLSSDWEVLGRAVHASWRDGMLQQGRTVEKERMTWETLPARDKVLDKYIAARVIAAAREATK